MKSLNNRINELWDTWWKPSLLRQGSLYYFERVWIISSRYYSTRSQIEVKASVRFANIRKFKSSFHGEYEVGMQDRSFDFMFKVNKSHEIDMETIHLMDHPLRLLRIHCIPDNAFQTFLNADIENREFIFNMIEDSYIVRN